MSRSATAWSSHIRPSSEKPWTSTIAVPLPSIS